MHPQITRLAASKQCEDGMTRILKIKMSAMISCAARRAKTANEMAKQVGRFPQNHLSSPKSLTTGLCHSKIKIIWMS
jgi:hypothetical protein